MMFVDPRRGSGELVRPLERLGIPVRKKMMKVADFKFRSGPGYDLATGGTVLVGIERKKTGELLEAVYDSRFRRRQASMMLRKFQSHAWLLVEGITEPDAEGILLSAKPFTTKRGDRMAIFHEAGYTRARHLYHNYMAFQATLQAKSRMQYMRTSSEIETAHWLASIYRWYQKPYDKHKSAYVVDETKPDYAVLSLDTLNRRVLAQLPGVGWERSKLVLRYMREHRLSLTEMFSAPVRDWMDALNIAKGKAIASTIVKALRETEEVRSRH